MKKEEMDNELIRRCEEISNSIKLNLPKSKKMFGKIHDKLAMARTADEFSKRITDELNKMIAERNISFKGDEKQELIDYLKPTYIKLIRKHITQ